MTEPRQDRAPELSAEHRDSARWLKEVLERAAKGENRLVIPEKEGQSSIWASDALRILSALLEALEAAQATIERLQGEKEVFSESFKRNLRKGTEEVRAERDAAQSQLSSLTEERDALLKRAEWWEERANLLAERLNNG